jgi:hypothetical protein
MRQVIPAIGDRALIVRLSIVPPGTDVTRRSRTENEVWSPRTLAVRLSAAAIAISPRAKTPALPTFSY